MKTITNNLGRLFVVPYYRLEKEVQLRKKKTKKTSRLNINYFMFYAQ